jgi:hypothetical protein
MWLQPRFFSIAVAHLGQSLVCCDDPAQREQLVVDLADCAVRVLNTCRAHCAAAHDMPASGPAAGTACTCRPCTCRSTRTRPAPASLPRVRVARVHHHAAVGGAGTAARARRRRPAPRPRSAAGASPPWTPPLSSSIADTLSSGCAHACATGTEPAHARLAHLERHVRRVAAVAEPVAARQRRALGRAVVAQADLALDLRSTPVLASIAASSSCAACAGVLSAPDRNRRHHRRRQVAALAAVRSTTPRDAEQALDGDATAASA